ncbi:NAD-dependent deacylase [Cryomorpha ignava]|uniref:NAD-dependent protein deacylase n=1 Tax=Cryomorpha ignava TaxID=101383 RepID=A0A7K3WTX2_9FLAO|nr:NAD-dependent deacylase [Cryomorpha ignava]NEN25137.1 NAD-dependent deacylase [Cryomorpha ignava]
MAKKRIVVFSGAGMSAESGIQTFRDNDGLWEQHRVEDVATPEAWHRDKELVLNFYNMRHKQLLTAEPNKAHLDLVKLEDKYFTTIITQNVDDLHERAGSSQVIHLHGELRKCRSEKNERFIKDMPLDGLKIGDTCPEGYQLRPHIVWFGEMVPEMDRAMETVQRADILLVIGTSLNVYPAAGLIYAAKKGTEIILIDPGDFGHTDIRHLHHIQKSATEGVGEVVAKLMHDL